MSDWKSNNEDTNARLQLAFDKGRLRGSIQVALMYLKSDDTTENDYSRAVAIQVLTNILAEVA